MDSLTTKELAALQDQLTMEENLIKKYTMYAQDTSDPQLKTKCEQIAAQHQSHFDKLFTLLK